MSKKLAFERLPKQVQVALQEAHTFVRASGAMLLLWERVLTEREKKQLGSDPEKIFFEHGGQERGATVKIWRKLHGGSLPRAILDIAHRLGYIDEQKRDWLLREVGEVGATTDADSVPYWNREAGELRFQGKLIRRVRVMSTSNIVPILDAFQSAHWATSVSNPLGRGAQQLHQSLTSLNESLKRIRFHAQEGARTIFWQLT